MFGKLLKPLAIAGGGYRHGAMKLRAGRRDLVQDLDSLSPAKLRLMDSPEPESRLIGSRRLRPVLEMFIKNIDIRLNIRRLLLANLLRDIENSHQMGFGRPGMLRMTACELGQPLAGGAVVLTIMLDHCCGVAQLESSICLAAVCRLLVRPIVGVQRFVEFARPIKTLCRANEDIEVVIAGGGGDVFAHQAFSAAHPIGAVPSFDLLDLINRTPPPLLG